MSNKIEDLRNRFYEARDELPEAKAAVGRERADAALEDRDPDPAILNRPDELAAELEQLPNEILAAEIRACKAWKAEAEAMIPERESKIQPAEDAWREAEAEYEAARQKVEQTSVAFEKAKSNYQNTQSIAYRAENKIARLRERGPVEPTKSWAGMPYVTDQSIGN